MKYEETKKLRDAFGKKPTRRWCEHVETVADEFEHGDLTDFSDPPTLIYHLTQRACAGATSREIETYLKQLWAERCPHVTYPAKQVPTRRKRGKKNPARKRDKKKSDPKRIQRLVARYTLLNQKSSWDRTEAERAEMANLLRQLQKYGIGVN